MFYMENTTDVRICQEEIEHFFEQRMGEKTVEKSLTVSRVVG